MTNVQRQDLPIWMQRATRGTDWGVLIVIAFSVLAALPFYLQPGLPRTNASEHYAYRAADYAQAIVEGRLLPRWSPNALSGYGAPIPQYYPPGAAYAPALLDVLLTNDATLAIKVMYGVALCVAGAAVYTFVTRRSGAAAGIVAGLLYVYSPYLGLIAPHLLGDMPGVISLALIPVLLWSVDRMMRVNRPFDALYVSLTVAGLVLTDIPAAIVGWMLAGVLLAWSSSTRVYYVVLAGAIGVGLAAFFWMPALLEADAIQWFAHPAVNAPMITLGELIAPLRPLDPGALIGVPQLALGLPVLGFALLSIPVIAYKRLGFHALYLFLGAALTVLSLAVFPSEVWLLGVITLCLSIGGSAITQWGTRLLPVLVAAILIAAYPIWLAPRQAEAPIDTSPAAQVAYEQQGYGIAVLPEGDDLPSTIPPDSTPNRNLVASYAADQVDKLTRGAGSQVGVLEHSTHGDRFQIDATTSVTFHVLTAYFPGWSARLNGFPLPIERADDGLMDTTVPNAVRGELTITLGETQPRTLGWVVSWLSLLALTLIAIFRPRSDNYEPMPYLARRDAVQIGIVVVLFAAALVLLAIPSAPLPTPSIAQAQPNAALDGSATLDNHTDVGLDLMAYRVDQGYYRKDDTIHLTLYWQAERMLTTNYQVRVSLLNLTTGIYFEPSDLRHPGGYPTTRWLANHYVTDTYAISLHPDFPGGNYSPALEVCATADCAESSRLGFFNSSGSPYGTVLVLPIILTVE